jgi:hypothetical protein
MRTKKPEVIREHEKFTKALASVLSVSPERIQESLAQARDEVPSPHEKYSYDPEAAETD